MARSIIGRVVDYFNERERDTEYQQFTQETRNLPLVPVDGGMVMNYAKENYWQVNFFKGNDGSYRFVDNNTNLTISNTNGVISGTLRDASREITHQLTGPAAQRIKSILDTMTRDGHLSYNELRSLNGSIQSSFQNLIQPLPEGSDYVTRSGYSSAVVNTGNGYSQVSVSESGRDMRVTVSQEVPNKSEAGMSLDGVSINNNHLSASVGGVRFNKAISDFNNEQTATLDQIRTTVNNARADRIVTGPERLEIRNQMTDLADSVKTEMLENLGGAPTSVPRTRGSNQR